MRVTKGNIDEVKSPLKFRSYRNDVDARTMARRILTTQNSSPFPALNSTAGEMIWGPFYSVSLILAIFVR